MVLARVTTPALRQMGRGWGDFIPASIQYEYDPDDLATKITTQMVHKSSSKTYV